MNAGRGHREIDHSGDVGVEAWAPTRTGLFEEATRGLFALIAASGDATAARATERPLTASAGDVSALLVDWLNEVILTAATRAEVYHDVRVDECDGATARGVVMGRRIDADTAALRFDVKAATYHGLEFDAHDGGYRARVIFDL